MRNSNGTATSPEDEPIEEVKEDQTVQSVENEIGTPGPEGPQSPNEVAQLSQTGSVGNLKVSSQVKRESQKHFLLSELLPCRSNPSRSDHKIIQFHLEDFKENRSLV